MRHKKRHESFNVYIYKVLKQVHPDTGLSQFSIAMVNSMVVDLFNKLMAAAETLRELMKREMCTSREIQTAVRLTLNGELTKHAVSEAVKAVTSYTCFVPAADGNRRILSQSAKAKLQFPVGRIARQMRQKWRAPVGKTAAVYMAAVLEYIAAEILELAGNASKDMRVKIITPRHITLGVRGDEELDTLFPGTLGRGGVVPHIHKSLVSSKKPFGGQGVVGQGFGGQGFGGFDNEQDY